MLTFVVQYYTNDWFHRILLILQLVTFATLSAFTKDFDAFNTLVDPHAVPEEQFACVETLWCHRQQSAHEISALLTTRASATWVSPACLPA